MSIRQRGWGGSVPADCGLASRAGHGRDTPRPRSRSARRPPRTCAVLLQAPDLGVQALEGARVLPLQEQQVLLRAVQLVLQVRGCHGDIQMACGRQTLVAVPDDDSHGEGADAACSLPPSLRGVTGGARAGSGCRGTHRLPGSLAPDPGLGTAHPPSTDCDRKPSARHVGRMCSRDRV